MILDVEKESNPHILGLDRAVRIRAGPHVLDTDRPFFRSRTSVYKLEPKRLADTFERRGSKRYLDQYGDVYLGIRSNLRRMYSERYTMR